MSIALDSETTGTNLLRGCEPFVFTACDDQGYQHYWAFRVDPKTRKVIYDRRTALEMLHVLDEHDEWVFHNAVFDLHALNILGRETRIKQFQDTYMESKKEIHDTQLMAHIADSLQKTGLKEQAVMRLGIPDDDEELLSKITQKAGRQAKKLGWWVATAEQIHPSLLGSKLSYKADYWVPQELWARGLTKDPLYRDVLRTYAVRDVERTMGLFILFQESLSAADYKVYDWHRKTLFPFKRMEAQGFHLNRQGLLEAKAKMLAGQEKALRIMERKTWKGFNPNSEKDVKRQLFERFKLPPAKLTKTQQPSSDKEAIKTYLEMDIPRYKWLFIKTFRDYKKYDKTLQAIETYQKHEVDGLLYTSFKIPGTKTVRVSSTNPNIQNIGKNKIDYGDDSDVFTLRQIFGPRPDHEWYCIDYSQLQIRIFAFAAHDRALIKGFEQGYDAHTFVAQRMFGIDEPDELQRRAAKAVNFGIIFGAGPAKINRMAGTEGAYELFVDQFPSVHKFLRACELTARRTGYIRTLGGYPLRVPYRTAYKAANYLIQGTEGQLVKEAMINIDAYLRPDPYMEMIMQVHDELDFEAKKGVKHTKTLNTIGKMMVDAGAKYGVLCQVDCKKVVNSWADGESYTLAI